VHLKWPPPGPFLPPTQVTSPVYIRFYHQLSLIYTNRWGNQYTTTTHNVCPEHRCWGYKVTQWSMQHGAGIVMHTHTHNLLYIQCDVPFRRSTFPKNFQKDILYTAHLRVHRKCHWPQKTICDNVISVHFRYYNSVFRNG